MLALSTDLNGPTLSKLESITILPVSPERKNLYERACLRILAFPHEEKSSPIVSARNDSFSWFSLIVCVVVLPMPCPVS